MSDYIKKSKVMSMLTQVDLRYGEIADAKANLSKMPTLDEKEIIRKPFERVVKRICDVRNNTPSTEFKNGCNASLHQIHREIDIDVKECGINE